MSDLSKWLRGMLVGPALPLNKETNFVEDVLKSTEMVADAEIYVETLPGCYEGLIERNRNDESKRNVYPDPDARLRVREDVLRNKCAAMVNHFADKKSVTDPGLKGRATDDFYDFYLEAITVRHPPSYNSYTGMMAMMNPAFLKRTEDIVMYGLGLTSEMPEERATLKSAPPPFHTVVVYVLAMSLCVWALPSMESIDEHATIETFTTSVFGGGPLSFPPIVLGVVRLFFAFTCMVTTVAKIRKGCEFKVVRLPGSKLRGGHVQMHAWKTQGFYTSWAWNLLGLSFLLGGTVPLLAAAGREDVLQHHPWILRAALISFEVAAPSAFLTSFIVAYALWPQAYRSHGPEGTAGFKGWINLLQHDGNSAMVLAEVCLMGGLPVRLGHAAFAPLFAGAYQAFLWFMLHRWSPGHGPVVPYFFMDTTLGARTTVFMVVLLAVIGLFFALFAVLDMGMAMIEHGDHGVVPNIFCVVIMSYLLMKFKD